MFSKIAILYDAEFNISVLKRGQHWRGGPFEVLIFFFFLIFQHEFFYLKNKKFPIFLLNTWELPHRTTTVYYKENDNLTAMIIYNPYQSEKNYIWIENKLVKTVEIGKNN